MVSWLQTFKLKVSKWEREKYSADQNGKAEDYKVENLQPYLKLFVFSNLVESPISESGLGKLSTYYVSLNYLKGQTTIREALGTPVTEKFR